MSILCISLLFSIGQIVLAETDNYANNKPGTAELYSLEDGAFILNNLNNLQLSMQFWNKEDAFWQTIPEQAAADGMYRIILEYDLYMSDLINCNGHLKYEIPECLRGVSGSGNLFNGEVQIGYLYIEEDSVDLYYDLSRFDLSESSMHGSCMFNVSVDTGSIPEDGVIEITDGEIHISIQLEADAFYKYVGLDIEKSVSPKIEYDESEQYYYLEYTLTLTAENTLSKAVVIDDFLVNAAYVESYIGLSLTETDVNVEQSGNARNTVYRGEKADNFTEVPQATESDPGVLVWSAYDMSKGEIRKLTYKVRLKDEFAHNPNLISFSNRASAFAGSKYVDHPVIYFQDKDETVFETQANIQLSKTNSKVYVDEAGREYAEHTVTIKAPETNSYILKEVVLHDWLGSDTKNKLVYDWSSFTLDGKSCSAKQGTESWGNCAEVVIDELNPGQEKTLTYRIWIKPESYLNYSGITHFDNSVQTVMDNIWMSNKVVARIEPIGKEWSKKAVDKTPVTQDTTIKMNDSFSDVKQFTVPVGSYRYQVMVNETGDWDVSGATFKDQFAANMKYVGYARIDAVDIHQAGSPVVKTAWLEIDGADSFSFKPADLSFSAGNYAYKLSYYAKPVMNITMTAQNSFMLSGTVGKGGSSYQLNVSSITVDLPLVGEEKCSMKKESWYYTCPEESVNIYNDRVTQYWLVRASGNLIQGMKFRDVPVSNTKVMPDSVAGIYVGDADLVFNAYSMRMEDLSDQQRQKDLGLTALVKDVDYTASNADVTLLKPVILEQDQEMFIVYRTCLNFSISAYSPTSYFTVWNNVNYSYDGGNSWNQGGSVAQIVSNTKGAEKSDGKIYAYDGSKWSEFTTGKQVSLPAPEHIKPGLYASWFVKVNLVGSIKGKVTITDTLPEGTSLGYVSLNSIGTWLDYNEPVKAEPDAEFLNQLTCLQYPMENEGVHLIRNSKNPYVMEGEKVYYDKTNNTVVWSADNLRVQDNKACENYYLVFRVMCCLEDLDYRSEESIRYTNIATVTSQLGDQVISDTVQCNISTLQKTGDRKHALSSGTYPFTIEANPKGLDLDPNNDTVVLVDEMNRGLAFKSETLEIVNSATGRVVDPSLYRVVYTVKDEKSIIEFVLPDGMPLTIRYNARVTVPPETKITISNTAYWKGYPSQSDAEVNDSDFQYEIGGTGATHSLHGTLKITKKSSSNLAGPALSGAVYALYPVSLDENDQPILGSELVGNVKETQGTYSYNNLLFNTVYCVKEIVAPEGYLIDESPYYVAISDNRDVTKYQELLDAIERLRRAGITVDGQFSSDIHDLLRVDLLDTSYSLEVHKTDGSDGSPLVGVGFTLYEEVREDTPGAVLIHTTEGQCYGRALGGEKITSLDNEGNARVCFHGLKGDGEHVYYLEETTGVIGYLTMNSAIPIQVQTFQNSDGTLSWNASVKSLMTDMNDRTLTIELENYAKLDIPMSGILFSSNAMLIFGLMLISIAIALSLFELKKQNKDK